VHDAFTYDAIADRHTAMVDTAFRGEPKQMGPITVVNFEDGCGNLINLVQTSTAGR